MNRTTFIAGGIALFSALASCIEVTYVDDGSGAAGAGAGPASSSTGNVSSSSTSAAGPGGGGGAPGGGGGQGGGGGTGGSGGCEPVTIEAAGLDSFDDMSSDGWCALSPEQPGDAIVLEDGSVKLRTTTANTDWNHTGPEQTPGYAPFYYRNIINDGDYVVIARVRATNDQGLPPTTTFHGGSLMIRLPGEPFIDNEHHVLIANGNMAGDPLSQGASWWTSEPPETYPSTAWYYSDGIEALAICKTDRFRFFAYDAILSEWLELTMGSGPDTSGFPVGGGRNLPLLQAPTVEIGVSVHAFAQSGFVEQDADWVDIQRVQSGNCVGPLPPDPTLID